MPRQTLAPTSYSDYQPYMRNPASLAKIQKISPSRTSAPAFNTDNHENRSYVSKSHLLPISPSAYRISPWQDIESPPINTRKERLLNNAPRFIEPRKKISPHRQPIIHNLFTVHLTSATRSPRSGSSRFSTERDHLIDTHMRTRPDAQCCVCRTSATHRTGASPDDLPVSTRSEIVSIDLDRSSLVLVWLKTDQVYRQ